MKSWKHKNRKNVTGSPISCSVNKIFRHRAIKKLKAQNPISCPPIKTFRPENHSKKCNIPTKTSQLKNDGEDGINPFITAQDIPPFPSIPTKTSELINDGENGVDPFITINDLPPPPTVPTKTSDLTNDGANGIDPFITLNDIPYQISKHPDLASFPLVGNDNFVYLAEDTGLFYLWNGLSGTYDQITNNAFPTGLERITEAGKTGWRLIGRNPANYGDIGEGAVDLSRSTSASSTRGATGIDSFAVGNNTTASGTQSVAMGSDCQATSQYAFVHGRLNQATNNSAEAGGNNNIASGNSSVSKGQQNRARSHSEFSIGHFGTDYTPVNSGAPTNTTDRAFNIGNGLDALTRSDAFTVFKNGAIRIFRATLASITNAASGFLISNSSDSNRPYTHNGTDWKGLAYIDEIPTNTSDLINDGEDGTSPYVTADQLPSNLSLFATNASSDIATYFKLVTSIDDPSYNTSPVDISTGAITTTNQFIASLATSAGVLLGNPGIINLTTVGNIRRTSGTGNAEFYYEVYQRNSGGTETLIATSSATPPITVGVYTEFIALALLNNGTFLPTDRIVIKYYANRVGSGSDPSYEFQFGGTSPVRTSFPVPASNLPFSLDTLSDVNITTPLNGQVLVYSGGVWVNQNDLLNLPFNIENTFVSLFNYLTIVTNITFSSNAANSNNQCHWLPFQLNSSVEIDSFTIINNTANASSGANSITIYIFDNSNDGLPGIKIHQQQSILGVLDTASQVITFNNNISLDKGNYWIGLHIRGLNTAGVNPTFVGANGISIPSINVGTVTFTNNNNFKLITTGVSTDIGDNPTVTSAGSTIISYPLVYIKSILP